MIVSPDIKRLLQPTPLEISDLLFLTNAEFGSKEFANLERIYGGLMYMLNYLDEDFLSHDEDFVHENLQKKLEMDKAALLELIKKLTNRLDILILIETFIFWLFVLFIPVNFLIHILSLSDFFIFFIMFLIFFALLFFTIYISASNQIIYQRFLAFVQMNLDTHKIKQYTYITQSIRSQLLTMMNDNPELINWRSFNKRIFSNILFSFYVDSGNFSNFKDLWFHGSI